MDLSNNDVEQQYYEEIMTILNDLDSLQKLNLSLENNKIVKVGFEELSR